MRFLTSPITVLMIILVAGMFVGSIPVYAASAASSAIMQYEKGMISEAELDQKLRGIGYSETDIRQVKAVIGVLEHQQEDYVPLSESVAKNMEEKPDVNKASKVDAGEADNIMLVMGIGGAVTVAAIVIAFSKRILS